MKARALPPVRLTPARDRLLDPSPAANAWATVKRWSPALVVALGLLAAHGLMVGWDAQVAQEAAQRETANARAELEVLRNAHQHRVTTGCSTLFYLVQGDVGERLYQAATSLDAERGKLIAEIPPTRRTK